MSKPPKRKRRWFQFSLRSLLVFTLIVAIPCAWLAREIERKRHEREAAETIVKLHGDVWYSDQLIVPSGQTPGVHNPAGPAWLREIMGQNFFDEIEEVNFFHNPDWGSAQISDERLDCLTPLTELKSLSLAASDVTDAGMVRIKELTKLQELDLSYTSISDAGLAHLNSLTNLQILELGYTNVTDAGLVQLKRFNRLNSLNLQNTRISDAGLESLRGLSELRWLYLSETDTADSAVRDLQKALPNCTIEH
jgi:hypothetical protein